MPAQNPSPDDIHSAVENESTPFGFAELYCCGCSRHGASCMQVSVLCHGVI